MYTRLYFGHDGTMKKQTNDEKTNNEKTILKLPGIIFGTELTNT